MEKNFINLSKLRNWRKPHYLSRLPEHYYKHRRQFEKPSSVGYDEKPKGKLLDYDIVDKRSGRVERIPQNKIPVEYPVESNYGLWHGEGIVKGFTIPERKIMELYEHVDAQVWFPKLIRSVLYSEILDTYFKVIITPRTKDAINEAFGFDFYILKTPVQDLKSQFGLDLRRELLIRLAKKDYYPDNEEKFKMIEEKYKEFIIPLEEAEWFGLPVTKAVSKQNYLELQSKKATPLKLQYTLNLLQDMAELKEANDEEYLKLQEEVIGLKTFMSKVKSKLPFSKEKSS